MSAERSGAEARPEEFAVGDFERQPHGDDRGAGGEESGAQDRRERHERWESTCGKLACERGKLKHDAMCR